MVVELPSYPLQEDCILTIKKDYMDLPTQGGGAPQLPSPGGQYTDYKERQYGPTDTGWWNSPVTLSRKTIY